MNDLTGRTFGLLTVVRRSPVCSQVVWQCRCECGSLINISANCMHSYASCGCMKRKRAKAVQPNWVCSHNEYRLWASMRSRCNNENAPSYSRYGGRGICVCERWSSFENFIADMGPRPTPKHSIDRIDNDGNYEPGNCRWATAAEQASNSSIQVFITFRGVKRTITEWAKELQINRNTLAYRIYNGWDHERALTTPGGKYTTRKTVRKRAATE